MPTTPRTMTTTTKILFLEDSRDDHLLIERELRKGGIAFTAKRVETKEEYLRAVREFVPDIVLSDYWLKDFDGLSALRLTRVLECDVPFILITGSTNEEVAVECMKAGASDYILKDRLARLVPAIRATLEASRIRAQKDEAEERARTGEERLRQITEHMLDLISQLDLDLRYSFVSPTHRQICGYEPSELLRKPFLDFVHPDDRARVEALARAVWLESNSAATELRYRNADGSHRWFEVVGSPLVSEPGRQSGVVLAAREITERKRMEEETRRQQAYLTFLSDSAMTFVDFPADADLYRFIADRARDLVGNAIVVVNSYDGAANALQTQAVSGSDSILERLLTFMSQDPVGDVERPDDVTRGRLLLGRLGEFSRGLGPFGFSRVPQFLRSALGAMMDLQGFYTIGLVQKTELLGSIVFVTRQRDLDHEKTVIETFAYQSSVALQRRNAEHALKESEEMFRQLVSTSPDGIAVTDLEGRLLSMNERNIRMLGYADESELRGRNAMDLIVEADRPIAAANMEKTLTEGFVQGVAYRLLRKDGSSLWGELSAAVVRDAEGRARFLMAVTRDISERKKTEEALRESELRFRELSDLLPQPVFEANANGRIMFANRSAFRAFGYDDADFERGVSLTEAIVVEDRERALETVRSMFDGTGTAGNEYLGQRKDGSTFPIVVYATPVRRQETVTGIRGIIIDISERKAQEAAIRASEERYRALVENASDAIILSDVETGIILEANERAAELTGRRLDELVGMLDARLHPVEDADRYRELIRAASDRMSGAQSDLAILRADGFHVPVDVSTKLFVLNGRRVQLAIFRDVTERRQAESHRRELDKQVQAIVEEAPFGAHLYELNASGQLIFVGANRAADQFLRVEHEPLVGKTIEEAFPGLIGTEIPAAYKRIARDGGRFVEEQVDYAEGSIRGMFEVHAFQTQPDRMAVFFRDITDRKRSEDALRESERRYRLVVEHVTDVIWTLDLETNAFTYVSPNVEKLRGYTAEEVLAQSMAEALTPESVASLAGKLPGRLAEFEAGVHRSYIDEIEQPRKDGTTVWTETSTHYVRNTENGRLEAHGVSRDITQRRQAQEALEENEEKFRTLVEQSSEGFALVDERGGLIEWNRAMEIISGLRRDEVLGRPFVEILESLMTPEGKVPGRLPVIGESIREALRTGRSPLFHRVVEEEIRPPRGERRFIQQTIFPVQTRAGFRLGSVTRDVTDQRRAEQELRLRQEQLAQLTANLTGVVYRVIRDTSGRSHAEYVSEGTRAMFGLEPGQILAKYDLLREIIHPDDRQGLSDIESKTTNSLEPYEREYRIIRTDGAVRWIHDSGRRTPTPSGAIVIDGFAADVTERKEAERAVEESEVRYRLLFNATSDAIIVHEISPEGPGRIIEVNDLACQQLGYTREELLRMSPKDLDAPEGAAVLVKVLPVLFDTGHALWEGIHVTKDGRRIPVEIQNQLFEFDGRQIALASVRNISDRKRAIDALRASESLTRFIAKHDPIGIAVFDRDMRYLSVSDRYLRDNNLKESEVIGRTHYDVLPGTADQWRETHRRCLHGAIEQQEEEAYERLDGSTGYSRWECRPWYDANGEIGGIVLYVEDVTKRKRAEDQLRKLSRAVEQSPSTIIITDTRGDIEYVNPRFTQSTGYLPEEVLGKNPRFLKSGLTQRDDYRIMWETIRGGREWHGEFLNRKKNRELFFEAATIMPIVDAVGRVTHFLAVKEDITQRKRMEQSLRQSEERYRMFFEEDLAGAFIASPEGLLAACNPAFAKIFGFSGPSEAAKENLFSLFPAPNYRDDLLQRLRRLKKIEYERLNGRRKDGKHVFLLQSVSGTFNEKGELSEIKGYVIDTTEERLSEDQYRQSQKMESLTALAGGVAHDFNNVLNNVIGFTGQIKKYASDPAKVLRYCETIEKSAMRGADLATNLLTATRQRKQEKVPTDLTQIIAEVEQQVRETLPGGITFQTRVSSPLPEVSGDRGSLAQLLTHLLSNGVEAMPSGGTLVVEACAKTVGSVVNAKFLRPSTTTAVELRVWDTGEGIPSAIRDKIFEPFFTTRDKGKGSGLGLAIVYNVVKDHGGTVLIDSEERRGTTVTVYLPAVEAAAGPSADVPAVPSHGNNELILLVDDEEPMQELGKELLEELGYRVVVAGDGLQAVEVFRKQAQEIKLAIIDLIMPGMDGGQTYVELKKIEPNVKAVFCSGFTSEKVITDLLKEENLRAIQKPFHPADFIRIVQEVLAGR